MCRSESVFRNTQRANMLPNRPVASPHLFMPVTRLVGQTTLCPQFWVEVLGSFCRGIYHINLVSVNAHWFLQDSLDIVHGKISGKQLICIHAADAERQRFPVHLRLQIQFPSVTPLSCRNITVNGTHIQMHFCWCIVFVFSARSK